MFSIPVCVVIMVLELMALWSAIALAHDDAYFDLLRTEQSA